MSEPFFIAQTFEPEHTRTRTLKHQWFMARAREALAKGGPGIFPRYTHSDDGKGLLFECWKERPKDQGEPRWQMTKSGDE